MKNVWQHPRAAPTGSDPLRALSSVPAHPSPAEPRGTFWDILALGFALGMHFQLFSLRICATKYTEKHKLNTDHGQEQQRRLKQDNVRVLRFPCPGFNTRC